MRKAFLFIAIFSFLLFPLQTFGQINNSNEIELTISPSKVLFDLTNIKPGDSITRNINIQNNGNQDFNYIASSKLLSGSEIFFDKLDLTIKDDKSVIYDGKLFEFNKLSPRVLKSKKNENLQFIIKVPMELGNEFQGLDTQFQFKFYVEGTLGGILPADGPKLPATGSNMFNILVAGATLILTGTILQFVMKRRKKLNKQL